MKAPTTITPLEAVAFDAMAEHAAIAATYADAAATFAGIRDPRATAYSLKCAALALSAAAEAAKGLQPAPRNGGTA